MKDNFFEIEDKFEYNVFVLIIYDITDNRRRRKLDKLLRSYGFRVQKSAFEAIIRKSTYKKLLSVIPDYATEEDSIRVYKIIGKGTVFTFGKKERIPDEDTIII